MNNNNPYAPPKAAVTNAKDTRCRREGKFVLIPTGSDLPARCIVCNAPAKTPVKSKKLYWHNPGWYLLVFLNLILYAVVALIVRKSANVSAGLCDTHVSMRKRRLLMAFAISLILIVFGGFMIDAQQGSFAVLAFTAAIATLIAAGIATRTVQVKEINESQTKLSGCKEPFLASLE